MTSLLFSWYFEFPAVINFTIINFLMTVQHAFELQHGCCSRFCIFRMQYRHSRHYATQPYVRFRLRHQSNSPAAVCGQRGVLMTLIITNAFEWVMLTLRCEVRTEYCSETVPSRMFQCGIQSTKCKFYITHSVGQHNRAC